MVSHHAYTVTMGHLIDHDGDEKADTAPGCCEAHNTAEARPLPEALTFKI